MSLRKPKSLPVKKRKTRTAILRAPKREGASRHWAWVTRNMDDAALYMPQALRNIMAY